MRQCATLAIFVGSLALPGCAHDAGAKAPPKTSVRPGTPPEVDIARARERGLPQSFQWAPYEKASFERAARENKLVLLDGAAEWCHWCHVMDATTYRDPEVGRILSERFVAIRVDIDEHPDMAERYGDWGWPATIILSSDGKELGKHRGYLPPAELLSALDAAVGGGKAADRVAARGPSARAASPAEMGWVVGFTVHTMDAYYDVDLGGWGRRQKGPIGENLEIEARRAGRGDALAKTRVLDTVRAQRNLLDPVWGGVYQYSDRGTWTSPHFEKLMTYQAANLAGYAAAYRATGDAGARDDARAVASYMAKFLSGPKGTFFVSQDADVGVHDPKATFVDGHIYYEKSDAERRALGMPRIDDHEYAFENGLAISAFTLHYESTSDAWALAHARRAADAILASHVLADGRVLHDAGQTRTVFHLSDAASFGLALASLARITKEDRYREAALRIANAMEQSFAGAGGTLYGSTVDADAIGVFTERRVPFEANALAARFYAALAEIAGDERWKTRGIAVLSAISTPAGIEAQGRFLGTYLLAADDLGLLESVLTPDGSGPAR